MTEVAQKPKKPVYGKPEPTNYIGLILGWGVIILGIIGIVWLVMISTPEKTLVCRSAPTTSLTGFGNCN